MKITIGRFNSADRSVRVTFSDGDFVHSRDVNAVLNSDGSYDRTGTRARVDQVAQGVAAKRALGVFDVQPAPTEEPPAAPTE